MAVDGSQVTAAWVAPPPGVTTQAASEMFPAAGGRRGSCPSADGPRAVPDRPGRAAADAIFRRHALLEWLLTSVVGLGWAESDEEAARLQGAISPRVEARLDEMLGHPETCPHGNPIDAATARRRPGRDPARPGGGRQPGTIYRITEEAEEDAGLLSYLEARALTPGAAINVLARSESLDSLTLDGPRGRATLGLRPAALIRILPGEADPALFHHVCTFRAPRDAATTPRYNRRMTGSRIHRAAPHRDRPDGAVQLPLRPAHRRHVHPAPGGHRRRALDAPTSRTSSTGLHWLGLGWDEGPGLPGEPDRGRTARIARWSAWPATAAISGRLLADDQAYPATARPPSSTPSASGWRRPGCRRATAAGVPTSPGRAGRLRGRGPPPGDPLPDRARRRGLRRPGPGPRRDRCLGAGRRPGHRPGRWHAALPLLRRGRRCRDGDQPRDPGRGSPEQHAQAHPAVPGPGPSRAAVRPPAPHPQSGPDEDEQAQEPDRGRRLHRRGLHPRGAGQLPGPARLVDRQRGRDPGPRRDCRAVQPGARPEGRRRLRSRAPRVAQRPVDPAPGRRRPGRPAAPVRAARGDAGRIDRMPADPELAALVPLVQERLPVLGAIGDLVDFLFADQILLDPAILVPKRWDRATALDGLRSARQTIDTIAAAAFEAEELEAPLRRWPRPAAGRPATCSWRSAWRSPAGRRRRRCSRRSSPWVASGFWPGSTRPSWCWPARPAQEDRDEPRRRPGLAGSLQRGLANLRAGRHPGPVQRRCRVPLPRLG